MTPKRTNSTDIQTLWNDHQVVVERALRSWARRLPGDPDIQDAIAATYERTLRYLQGGGAIRHHSARGWLITVSRREFLRLIAPTPTRTHDGSAGDATDGQLADPAPDPEEIAIDHAEATLDGELQRALGRLTPRQRTVLLENHAGYTYREIQERHGLSETAVNKAIQKARTKLRNDGSLGRAYREWSD